MISPSVGKDTKVEKKKCDGKKKNTATKPRNEQGGKGRTGGKWKKGRQGRTESLKCLRGEGREERGGQRRQMKSICEGVK